MGEDAARIPPVNPVNTGDGFRLGEEAGGYTLQMDRLYEGLRFKPSKRPDLIKMLPALPALPALNGCCGSWWSGCRRTCWRT
ncbi:hypothetical protein G3I19_24360 [Streptomyces sp. SID10853]|uniref:hypothetical protein n=1 Tax=Streptomyces sp. SID10853 TaxID=2706028 RepID=UPI0013C13F60|nr:hypothetical protein [Streptomyces sp. SID10853]NDZ81607.1 hypothetical protein [Streptomyces sp. SID10853]